MVLNTSVNGLPTDTVNTASAICTEQVGGTALPAKESQDLCEVQEQAQLVVDKECSVGQFDFCPRTPGYWKNHRSDWPVDTLVLGGVSYDEFELMEFLRYGGEDASLKLARHLVATKFNLLSGSDPVIQPAVHAADAFLAVYPPGSDPQGAAQDEALEIKDLLDTYNNIDCTYGQHPTTASSEVTITVENPEGSNVTLTQCVVTDDLAPNCNTVIPTLAPGDVEIITCSAPDLMASAVNQVSVTCNVESSTQTITRIAEDVCEVDVCEVVVDKQVDCGAGFIDVGDVDESCSAQVGEPVTIRWLASAGSANTVDLVECVLTDSNGVALGDPFLVGSPIDPSVVDLELTRTTEECSALFAGGEPDMARLVCGCAGQVDPQFTVEDRDTASFECVEPGFTISKDCATQDANGVNEVVITLTNTGDVDLVCDVSDPLAGFFENGVLLPEGGAPVVLTTEVDNLASSTENSATADCTELPGGTPLPTETATDVCEVAGDCDLTVDKTCLVVPAPAGDFDCSDAKPINVVAMIWDGPGTVDIEAWKGSVGSTSLGTITDIAPGQEIAVVGYAGSPNDVYWEIFESGTNFTNKRGESKFHLSCSDSEMNGPEDCGKYAGDGKSDEAGLINDWRFEGLEGEGLVLDCTPTPGVPAELCEAALGPLPSCETVGDPDTLTWRYSGGGCAASDNSQEPGKSTCTESSPGIDGGLPVTVTDDQGNVFDLDPEGEFTTSRSASQTFFLSQVGRWEDHEIHVSCSQPLVAGESYGSLSIAALDGNRADVEIEYEYTVTNGSTPLTNVSIVDDKIDLGIAPFGLGSNETRVFSATSRIEVTTENRVDVEGELPSGQFCAAHDTATVVVTEPEEPCFECAGGVTELAFRNIGPAGHVVIEDNNAVLFSDFMATGDATPTLEGTKSDGKFDGDVEIHLDGHLVADIHTSCSQPIGVGMEFGGFEVVSGRSKDGGPFCAADCKPTQLSFEVKDDEVKMRIANSGQTPLQISRIEVEWPAGKKDLEKIEFDGTIWQGAAPPPSFTVDSGWSGSPTDRALDPGDDHDLKLRFDDKQRTGSHRLHVEFTNGCFLEASSH